MKKTRRLVRRLFLLSLFVFAFFFTLPAFAADEEIPPLEEIAKTEAAKFYVAKQYRRALEEFKKLEVQYPRNIIIKRYIASLHDSLREFDEATRKLNEALAIRRDDVIARQLLGEIYLKQADLDRAAAEFKWILDNAPQTSTARSARKRMEEIERLKAAPAGEEGRRMAVQDFMRSVPARAFTKGDYEEALAGFEELLPRYPDDILIRRFRAIALLRLNRRDEAIQGLQEALLLEPDNVALHFYLGQAYLENKQTEEARKEFQWVIAEDEGTYKVRAQQAIFQTIDRGRPAKKPWSVNFTNGYEYDTNATFKSRDDRLNTAGDMNSSVFNTTLTGSYKFLQKKKWTYTADGLYNQSLYSDFPHLQTYTAGAGLSALYVFELNGKPAALNVRDGATMTFLKNKFYVWTHSLAPTLIYNPHRRVRNTLSYRFNYNEYDSSGTNPPLTNRDGFANIFGLLNTFYLNDKKTAYFNAGYDFERHDTHGRNFIKNVHGARTAIHFPLVAKIESDWSLRYKHSVYNQYAFAPPKRQDDQFIFTIQLSRPLREHLEITSTYVYEDTTGKNNLYEYRRHNFGISLSLKY